MRGARRRWQRFYVSWVTWMKGLASSVLMKNSSGVAFVMQVMYILRFLEGIETYISFSIGAAAIPHMLNLLHA